MGLDMYLTKKMITKGQFIEEEVGYWRKANAIHKWFVDNVQGGIDECQRIYVSYKKLKELLDICKEVKHKSVLIKGKVIDSYTFGPKGNNIPNYSIGKVIKDPTAAEELLPSTSGFFFGGTEYDEYYLKDIENTIEILEKVLKDRNGKVYYQASW